ncbi:MAG: hypothetical protein J6X55_18115 [Victivallales bacterium]|nr:hypothetical protein [Victivallales bacterium]
MGTTSGDYIAEVPPQSPTVLRIEERREHPWLLSCDMTIRQGESEVTELQWDEDTMTLSGKVTRAKGEEGNLFFLMKDGYAPVTNEGLVIVRYIRDWDMVIKKHIVFTKDTEEFQIPFKESEKTKGRPDVFLWF